MVCSIQSKYYQMLYLTQRFKTVANLVSWYNTDSTMLIYNNSITVFTCHHDKQV